MRKAKCVICLKDMLRVIETDLDGNIIVTTGHYCPQCHRYFKE